MFHDLQRDQCGVLLAAAADPNGPQSETATDTLAAGATVATTSSQYLCAGRSLVRPSLPQGCWLAGRCQVATSRQPFFVKGNGLHANWLAFATSMVLTMEFMLTHLV